MVSYQDSAVDIETRYTVEFVNNKIGKAGGKTCNMPMDSDAEFEKRVKRYDRQRQAAAEAAEKARLSAVKNETEVEAVPA